ncbi:chromatin/chromatin-binding, or -regulatory protein [Lithospermum erythrorhizon]|uniref:Chromatin/chromatin-binding, or -regulatory protein n=1 Tax=Lithospermum erythrorhizon TaxID=34254 RepID=A0AAV3Q665_LITER
MGNPKQKWTAEEEEALRAGDKWRNLSIASGLGSRDKSKGQKAKAAATEPPSATPLPKPQATPSSTPLRIDAPAELLIEDTTKCLLDGKTASKYNAMIFEALSTLKEPNGSDTSSIVSFIERRQEVPQNFRKLLGARLRRLVSQDKLEKVQNCFRIKREILQGAKPSPNKQESQIKPSQTVGLLGNTVEEAVVAAAYKVAEAENKSFVASEAVKEAERVSKLAEESDAFLQLAMEILEKCNRGEIVQCFE